VRPGLNHGITRQEYSQLFSNNRGRHPAPVAATAGPAPHAAHATGAAPALAAAPAGFTVAGLTAKAGPSDRQQDYTARQAGYPRVITQIG
jgi:hypothetical protein